MLDGVVTITGFVPLPPPLSSQPPASGRKCSAASRADRLLLGFITQIDPRRKSDAGSFGNPACSAATPLVRTVPHGRPTPESAPGQGVARASGSFALDWVRSSIPWVRSSISRVPSPLRWVRSSPDDAWDATLVITMMHQTHQPDGNVASDASTRAFLLHQMQQPEPECCIGCNSLGGGQRWPRRRARGVGEDRRGRRMSVGGGAVSIQEVFRSRRDAWVLEISGLSLSLHRKRVLTFFLRS